MKVRTQVVGITLDETELKALSDLLDLIKGGNWNNLFNECSRTGGLRLLEDIVKFHNKDVKA